MPIVKNSLTSNKIIRSVGEIYNNIKDGHTDLTPAYQRPSVWTEEQKINLIYSLLHGIPVPAVTINDRWAANQDIDAPYMEAVIDGKQRLEAIVDFMDDNLPVPSAWFHEEYLTNPDSETVTYSQLTRVAQRDIKRASLPVVLPALKTEQEEAAHYLLVNTGGTEQTEADLENAWKVANGA